MKIVTYNIQFTRGRDGRFDLPRVAATIAEADIIGLQEVDRFWRRTGMQDQALALAEHFPGYDWVFAAGCDAAAHLPDRAGADAAARGRRRQHGNMVLSRWPILTSRSLRLPKATTDVFSMDRVLCEAVIDAPGGPLRVYITHLCHLGPETRLPQVAQIIELFRSLPREGACWSGAHPKEAAWTDGDPIPPYPDEMILMGDLNFTPDSKEYATFFGAGLGLVDSWRALGRDPLAPEDYSLRVIPAPHVTKRIDHIMVSESLQGRVRKGWIDQAAMASDHYPVWIELS